MRMCNECLVLQAKGNASKTHYFVRVLNVVSVKETEVSFQA